MLSRQSDVLTWSSGGKCKPQTHFGVIIAGEAAGLDMSPLERVEHGE